jgi:hypothetical protein
MTPIDDLGENGLLDLLGQAASLPSAPSAAVRAALELWRDHAPPTPLSAGSRVRRWVAALTFDSWATPAAAAGIRGVPSESRHLLFAAAGRDIDVRIAPMTAGFVVSGQDLGPDRVRAAAWHPIDASAAMPQQPVELTPSGEFCIEGVERGTYALELDFGDDDIVLAPIVVGARGIDS